MAAQYELLKELLNSGTKLSFGQDFFFKFYQAFLLKDRWMQYINGVGTTLLVTALALALGVVLGGIDFYPKKKIKTITDVTRRFYNNWDEEKYRHYLELFHIDESKRVDQLSSGMKVKYMIALALSHNARLLILDEPTSGLDPVVRDEILTIFADFTRDEEHAVLISSHIVSDLEKICDYIAFLHKGRLLLCEEKDRLTEAYGILRGGAEDIDPAAVCGRHTTPYGTEYLVRRSAVPAGMALGQVNIEDLFVFMAKEV